MQQGSLNSRGEVLEDGRKLFSVMQKDTEQAHVILGMPGIPSGDDDRYAAMILDSAMGGPMSSRLFQEVREKRGLAYAVYATTMPFMGAAQFAVYAGTRPANLEEVVGIIKAELAKVVKEGITDEELRRIQEYVVGHTVLGMESTRSRMTRLGKDLVNGLDVLSVDEAIARLRAVTLDDVLRIAQRIYTQEPTVAVISPLDPDALEEKLSAI
jgi:predicted Zn-dependent peptidase